ncbi:MAG: hypothetical protein IFK94_12285 [Acidobacteria bacterium]|uniref:Cohesin domain-containing protein n=1 Tax=Candidatus Polarisedimenticola svalbardensis TaxID=2886004 RepID=A0A8J6Y283_9BACT|nr:hypothetical protein [Candidatus Polarisedimenticola svalbardensis]
MKSVNRVVTILSLLAVVFLTACGGGGGDVASSGGGSSLLAASFSADEQNPGQNSVSLQEGSSSGNRVTVLVQVTDTVNLTGGTFDVTYDPARFTYMGSSAGDLFESSGVTPIYGVNEPVSGHLVIGVGSATAVGVNGAETLIRLSFRADAQGSGQVVLDLADLLGASGQAVPGVAWFGGTLIGT